MTVDPLSTQKRRVMIIAPQPFFQERGTPIAVRLGVETLTKQFPEIIIDLLTFGEGAPIDLGPRVNHYRCYQPACLRNIAPGLSLKKIITDFFLTCLSIKKLCTNRYDLIHGVEEGGIIAWILSKIFRVPYIFDIDSKIVADVLRQWQWLKIFIGALKTIEATAIKHALGIITMCDSLAERAAKAGGKNIHIVTDCSLIDEARQPTSFDDLRQLCNATKETPLLVYIGNLEPYQGIDLLIESIGHCNNKHFRCAIIGGSASKVLQYKKIVEEKGLHDCVYVLGPRPITSIGCYLQQADVLVSPRTTEANTPMKIYSYLHAGKAILATNLSTHTQVLSQQWSLLVEPNKEAFAHGISSLVTDASLRTTLGAQALKRATEHHTPEVFEKAFAQAYQHFFDLL